MYRFSTILIPLIIFFLGICACYFIRSVLGLPALNILLSWAVGLLLALIELKLLKNIDEDKLKYFLLDGAIFPFFSVGVAAGLLI